MKPFRFLTTLFVLLVSIWAQDMWAQAISDPHSQQSVSNVQHPVSVAPAQNILLMPVDKTIADPYVGRYQIDNKSWPVYKGPKGGLYIMKIAYDSTTGGPVPDQLPYKYYIPTNSRSKIILTSTDSPQFVQKE